MKKTTLGLGGMLTAVVLSLTACGGADEEKLAQEYCDLAQDSTDAAASGDPEAMQKANDAVLKWLDDNKDAKGDDKKFSEAIEEKCGDLGVTP